MTIASLLLAALYLLQPIHALGGPNLLTNPSFDAPPSIGATLTEGWAAPTGGAALEAPGHTGPCSLRLDGPASGAPPTRVLQDLAPVTPEATYRVDCWVRATAQFRVVAQESRGPGLPPRATTLLTGAPTPDWCHLSATWYSSDAARTVTVALLAETAGSVWFDDLSLVCIAQRPRLMVPAAPPPASIPPGLDASEWGLAITTTSPFLALDAGGGPSTTPTLVSLMHDGGYLHLRFDCAEPAPQMLLRQAATPGPQVWADDCVEAFIAPEGPTAGVIHLGISAAGGTWQERVGGRQWYSEWYSWAAGPAAIPPWHGAATVAPDRWRAVASIPLSALGGPRAVGRPFGLQLCRTRRAGGAPQYSTWAYTAGVRYARPEGFGTFTLATAIATRPLEAIPPEAAPQAGLPAIVPPPVQCDWQPGCFIFTPASTIRITGPDQSALARQLQDDIRNRFGLLTPVSSDPAPPVSAGDIHLGLPPEQGAELPAEGYILDVTPGAIRLTASDPRGRQWGLATLRQMISATGPDLACRCAHITDHPALAIRAWHLTSPLQSELPAYHRFLETMALLKLNTLVLQVDDRMQYASHPAISRPDAASADQLAELVSHASRLQIEVIPQLSTFSHSNYVLRVPAYAGLAESPRSTLGKHDRWNYCPLHPDVYPLVFDLMQEIVGAFAPRRFHIGHDEVAGDDVAACPRCRGRTPADLWATDIIALAGWLRGRGIQPAMWADSLLADRTGGRPHDTFLALDRIPRDILLLDWAYEPQAHFARTLSALARMGFQVVGCPWYEPGNIMECAAEAASSGALGACGTTWLELAPALTRSPHMPAALALGAQVFWAPIPPGHDPPANPPVPAFNRVWRIASGEQPQRRFATCDLAPHCNADLVDDWDGRGWMGEGPDYDLRHVRPGLTWIGEVPFEVAAGTDPSTARCLLLAGTADETRKLPQRVLSVAVEGRASALNFLHCTGLPSRRDRRLYAEGNPGPVGYYLVHYADGGSEVIPLLYQGNIDDWNSQRGPAQAVAVTGTQTAAGALVTLAAVRWPNPRPDVAITTIDVVSLLAGPRLALLGLCVETGGAQPDPVP